MKDISRTKVQEIFFIMYWNFVEANSFEKDCRHIYIHIHRLIDTKLCLVCYPSLYLTPISTIEWPTYLENQHSKFWILPGFEHWPLIPVEICSTWEYMRIYILVIQRSTLYCFMHMSTHTHSYIYIYIYIYVYKWIIRWVTWVCVCVCVCENKYQYIYIYIYIYIFEICFQCLYISFTSDAFHFWEII